MIPQREDEGSRTEQCQWHGESEFVGGLDLNIARTTGVLPEVDGGNIQRAKDGEGDKHRRHQHFINIVGRQIDVRHGRSAERKSDTREDILGVRYLIYLLAGKHRESKKTGHHHSADEDIVIDDIGHIRNDQNQCCQSGDDRGDGKPFPMFVMKFMASLQFPRRGGQQ